MDHYGLIGHPVAHSFSQRYFSEKFERESIRARYDLFDLPDVAALPALIADRPELRGLNVTVPHKQTVITHLDALDDTARTVGAVNVISIRTGALTGHNTDVEGFRSMLAPLLNGERPRALVLGSGGASRAVAFVLRTVGIKFRVVSRDRTRGDLTYDMVDPIVLKVCPLIINTTPVGQFPDVDAAPPLPYAALTPKHLLIDLVYNPERTLFLKRGTEHGAHTSNGLPMLHAQAEAAWRIWNYGS
ncbi:MAG: shikimate dehydrogenase [Flavobacteriales bacterium]